MSRRKLFTEEEKQNIIIEYRDNKVSSKVLGKKYGTSDMTILKNLREWGIPINSRKLNIKGLVVGELTVLKEAPKRDDRYTRWVCKCSCGKYTEVRTDYLTSGHTRSCGHLKDMFFSVTDLDGQEFGRLTVLYNLPGNSKMCLCECGNEISVVTSNLLNGNTQSCGCLKSKGELKINSILNELGIEFISQYSPQDFKFSDTNHNGYFDYAFIKEGEVKLLMEYDGMQHFTGWAGDKDSLRRIQKKDEEKNQYCKDKGIKLVRVPYTQYENIDHNFLRNIMEEMEG